MWRYGLVLSRKTDVADDLVQGAALKALDKSHQFRPGTRLDAWVFTIMSNLWRNQLRAEKIRLGQGVVLVEEVDIAGNNLDAETNFFAAQVLKRVMDLPEAQRDAVFLVYVEGYSYVEAAGILEVPVGTIMSRLATSRRKLNEMADDPAQASE